jgi:hypothetical protein
MATAGPSKPTVFARVLEVLDTDPPELLLLIEDQVRQYPAPQTPPPPPGTLLPLDQFGKSTPPGKGGQGGFLLANSDSGMPGHLGADALRWRSLGHAPSRMALLRFRQQMLRELRAWFDERDFLEVETPLLVSAPSPEAQFQPFAVTVEGASAPAGFLITSPEFQMKRMLVGGFPRIYQICRCFRGLESGQRHNPEFSMLEWYRAGWNGRGLGAGCGGLYFCAPAYGFRVARHHSTTIAQTTVALDHRAGVVLAAFPTGLG